MEDRKKDKLLVELENGYLVLNSRESIDLFNELSSTGTIWEQLSVLFNDYALNNGKDTVMGNKVDDLQKIILSMAQKLNSMTTQLPAPSSNINIDNKQIITPSKVEIKEIKKTKVSSNIESLMSKMKKYR